MPARAFFHQIWASRTLSLVAALWFLTVLVIGTHAVVKPEKNTVFPTYYAAGKKWVDGDKIYKNSRRFVYSPLAAAAFAPFTKLPLSAAGLLWRVINIGAFVGGVAWWLRSGLHRGVGEKQAAWVFLLLLPLSLGNFHNAQVNPLIISLMLAAILACRQQLWTVSAIAIGIATYFKIYPLAVGLLLLLLYPRQLWWRLAVVLISMGALTFILQDPLYVKKQYQLWMKYRLADNRFEYDYEIASRDFLMILRALHIPITQKVYQLLQVGAGAAIAVLLLAGRIRGWAQDRLLVALLSLVSCWMMLFGPSTESATYVIMAPALAFALVQACSQPERYSKAMRTTIIAATVISVVALEINALVSRAWVDTRTPPFMAIQPTGALLFLIYSMLALRPRYWENTGAAGDEGSPANGAALSGAA